MRRFTSEFGMGSGGSNALWSSSNSVGESVFSRFPEWVCDVLRCSVCCVWFALRAMRLFGLFVDFNRLTRKHQIVWVLYGQASRAISMG